jgi:hypothetical protein
MIQRIGWLGGLLFLVWGVAFAQRTWEGTATVARYGEFPPSGMYGASNSFERNSIVDVENLSNGKRARIIITGRVSDPTQFLVVSEQVAAELGIGKFDVARVRVSPVVTPGIDPSLVKPELPLSPDPDINPSARVSKASESPASGPPSSSETPRTPPVASTSPVAPSPPTGPATSEPSATSPAPAIPEPSRVETPSVTPKVPAVTPAVTPSEGAWKEPDAANPYAGLEASLAKRDKSAFAGLSMVLEAEPKEGGAEAPSPVSPAIPPLAPSPTPSPGAEAAGAEAPRVAELPMEAVKPESKETGPLAGPPASEGETQTELQLALEPTGPKPPEGGGKEKFKEEKAPSATAEVADAASKLSFPIQEPSALQRGFYYLQLGMFVKPRSAQSLWERFHRDYPLVVLKEEVGLRVLVGPLQGDERGVLYQTFKALGLKDAFFVKID